MQCYKSVCAPLCCKNLCCACPGGHEAKMLNLGLPDEVGKLVTSSTQDQKTRTVSTSCINPGGLSLNALLRHFATLSLKGCQFLLYAGDAWRARVPVDAGLMWMSMLRDADVQGASWSGSKSNLRKNQVGQFQFSLVTV